MTIINEDWEHVLQHEAMYSIEEQMQIEEDYQQWLEYENQLPAIITVNFETHESKNKIWKRTSIL